MQQALQRSNLVPSGFVVESAYFEGDKAVIAVRASNAAILALSKNGIPIKQIVRQTPRRNVTTSSEFGAARTISSTSARPTAILSKGCLLIAH
jgi:hypothetical protein